MLRLTPIDDIRNSLCTWRFAKINADFRPQFRYPTPDRSDVAQLRSAIYHGRAADTLVPRGCAG